MDKKKISVLSIVLYVLAGILAFYAVWSLITSSSYIAELITLGQLTFSGNEFDIIDFFMSSSSQYVVFAVILFALGRVYQKIVNINIRANEHTPVSAETTNRDNFIE